LNVSMVRPPPCSDVIAPTATRLGAGDGVAETGDGDGVAETGDGETVSVAVTLEVIDIVGVTDGDSVAEVDGEALIDSEIDELGDCGGVTDSEGVTLMVTDCDTLADVVFEGV